MKMGAWRALESEHVRHVGQAVAVVVAETRAQARDAADAVEVEYEPLPAVVDALDALKDGAPQLHEEAPGNLIYDWEIGDAAATEAAFASAAHVTRMEIRNNRLVPNPMGAARGPCPVRRGGRALHAVDDLAEPACGASGAVGLLQHRAGAQAQGDRAGCGRRLRVEDLHLSEEMVCLWASKKTGVPVKWTCERTEAFLTDAHGRDHYSEAEMALDAQNRILGLRVKTVANLGAYMSLFSSSVPTYLYATLLSGQYAIPAIHCNVKTVYTNTVPVDAYRGAGRPEATYLLERMMETAAREVGMDPAEFRRANFIRSFPHQTPVIMCYDAGDYDASLEAALSAIDYAGFAARKAEAARRGKLRGIGLSCYIEACGIAPSQAVGSLGAGVGLWESAEVRVNPVGTIEVLTGSHSHGQGHETTFAQLVAERFGVGLDTVAIVHGDTDKVQFGMGTYGSRSGAVGMSAIVKALDKVEAKAKRIAAHLLEASEGDIALEGGTFKVAGTDKELPFFQVALAAYTAHNLPAGMEPGLKEGAFYDPTNFTFPAGTYVCEVEVDPETGKVEIVDFVAADDFGTIINPMIVEGQVHGGLTQGIGQALLENASYDADGQLLSASYMDYTMPRADDVPSYR